MNWNILISLFFVLGSYGVNLAPRSTSLIASTILDRRTKCDLVDSMVKDRDIGCNFTLPDNIVSFFESEKALICFGIYDNLYELCSFPNVTIFTIPSYEPSTFCNLSKKLFVYYNHSYSNGQLGEWATRLRSSMSDNFNCSSLCVYGSKEVKKNCALMISAMEKYSELQFKRKEQKPEELKSPLPEISAKTNSSPVVVVGPKALQSSLLQVGSAQPAAGQAPAVKKLPSSPPEPQLNDPVIKPEDKEDSDTTKTSPPAPPIDPEEEENQENSNIGQPEQSSEPLKEQLEEHQPEVENSPKDSSLPHEDKDTILMGEMNDNENSNLVTYFILMTGGALLFYLAFHNKNKLLALALEGRRSSRRGGRHSTASYSKLHSNLEETIASGSTSPSATHVLY